MRWFAVGIGIFLIETLVALVFQDWSLLIDMSGLLGLLALFLAAVFSGAVNTGDRIRANYRAAAKEEHQERRRWSQALFIVGLINLSGSLITYLLL